MKKHLTTLIASAACLIAGTAQAQMCCGDSYYVGAVGGLNFINDVKSHGNKFELGTGYLLGVNAGCNICDDIRLEAEFSFRNNSKTLHKHTVSAKNFETIKTTLDANIKTYALMANAYYDFKNCSCFTPYVGVGIGYAWNDVSLKARVDDYSFKGTGSSNRFAWQAMAGVDYDLCQDIKVGVEYRFFNPGKKLDEHTVALTFKYAL